MRWVGPVVALCTTAVALVSTVNTGHFWLVFAATCSGMALGIHIDAELLAKLRQSNPGVGQ